MKKILALILVLSFTINSAFADFVAVETNVNMDNFWEKNGKEQQKVLMISSKLVNANKFDKRMPVVVARDLNAINANTNSFNRRIQIYTGLLPYIDNDDELAAVISHEMGHNLDLYKGSFGKILVMTFNGKQYEYKADLVGIDIMTKAGYNPIAAITVMNKIGGEDLFDFGLFTSHPTTSKRLIKMYEYIYIRYPWALNSDMTKNINYQNFLNSSAKDIEIFKQKEEQKSIKTKGVEAL